MIIVDTNVLSELIRHRPDPSVLTWLDSFPAMELATTAVTAAELLHGVERLPAGKRKTVLTEAVRAMLDEDFRGRVHSFDVAAAEEYARLVGDRERRGFPIAVADAQIAAVCRVHRSALATRNTKDFLHTGVELIDPWQHPGGAPERA